MPHFCARGPVTQVLFFLSGGPALSCGPEKACTDHSTHRAELLSLDFLPTGLIRPRCYFPCLPSPVASVLPLSLTHSNASEGNSCGSLRSCTEIGIVYQEPDRSTLSYKCPTCRGAFQCTADPCFPRTDTHLAAGAQPRFARPLVISAPLPASASSNQRSWGQTMVLDTGRM